MLNWAHPCRYMLYSAESGVLYDEVEARFPPYMNEDSKSFGIFHGPVGFTQKYVAGYRKAIWRKVPDSRLLLHSTGSAGTGCARERAFLQ